MNNILPQTPQIKTGPLMAYPSNISSASDTPIRHDIGKTAWTLVPFEALEEIAQVLQFGANKYGEDNWKAGTGFSYKRVLNSLLRHIFSFMRGEDKDPESGLSHIAHAGCNILFLLYYLKNNNKYSNDDRKS